MLDKFEKFNGFLADWFEKLGLVAMLIIMFVTCADVIGGKVFNTPILGALDIAMLCQIIAISFAGSTTLNAGRHIEVEFFFDKLPRVLQNIVSPVIHVLGLVLLGLAAWQLGRLGYSFKTSGEYSPTAYIPMFPFAFGAALAIIPVCLILLHKLIKSLTWKIEK